MSAADTTHRCPGCEAPGVPRHQLACKPCWFRLPADLRIAVNVSLNRRLKDPSPHRQALAAAMAWYREHPRSAA